MKDEAVAKLEAELDRILAKLVEETHGSRSTLRFDDPARGWDVGLPCAKAVKPGVKSMRKDASINQRASNPVKWMEKHRKTLVQPDIINSPDPAPPPALMSAYGAKAQMLSPVFNK